MKIIINTFYLVALAVISPKIVYRMLRQDRYRAGIGIIYNFLQDYSALISYRYTRRESDLAFDNYDENRLLLLISWQQDLLRW